MTSILKGTTPIPNCILDKDLAKLRPVELKVLLYIIRKTLGYHDPNTLTNRKEIERIALSYLALKTGCSRRAISDAIHKLQISGYIDILDPSGYKLHSPALRKGKPKLLFRIRFGPETQRRYLENVDQPAQKFLTIKEILTNNNYQQKSNR